MRWGQNTCSIEMSLGIVSETNKIHEHLSEIKVNIVGYVWWDP